MMWRYFLGYFKTRVLKQRVLRSVELAVTYDCNLRCDKCFALKWLNEENKRDYMTIDQIKKMWDQAYKLGAVHVNITGGEPLMRRDIVDVVKALKPKRTLVSIVTTGIFLTEEKARELKKAGLNTFQISLDSSIAVEHDKYRGYKGSYEKVFQAVEIARKVGINVILSTVITHQNVKTPAIPNMLDIAEKNDTFLLLNIAGRSGGWSKKDYLLVEKEERNKFVTEFCKHPRARISQMFNFYGKPGICNMGKDKLNISAYGEVYPCTYVAMVFGRLKDRSLKDIWDQMNEFKYFKGFTTSCRRVDDEEFAKKYISKLAMHDKPYMNLEDVEAQIKEEERSDKPTTKVMTKLPVVDDNGLLISGEGNGCYTHGGCGSDCGCEE
jgi:MoaA/NifB/PqqE/SkfB family radical SAM enzyme